jgi:hypothetical protein
MSAADGSTETVRTIGRDQLKSVRGKCFPIGLTPTDNEPPALGLGDFGFSTESLILAQDERWRRA